MLPEERRLIVARSLHELAIEDFDTQFSKDGVKNLLTKVEYSSIQKDVKDKVINNMESIIEDLSANYDEESDPEDHFSDLTYSINDYEDIFLDDDKICEQLSVARDWIEDEIKEMTKKRIYEPNEVFERENHSVLNHSTERSIFDDVDS